MDLALRNAVIIDGTGKDRFQGDIGVSGGKIVAVGSVPETAQHEIDVAGDVVAPGFIDCHTHYDAQVTWDKMLSPSVYHGVTTVLAGNCGFTLAPLSGREADTDYLLAMLSRVEGMPLVSLKSAVKPSWKTFGEYLDAIDGTIAINTAFMVGHSTLRRFVMGDRAVGHEATPSEIDEMVQLLRKSLAEGGTGFSTTVSPSHSDHNGDPVPSRFATDEEILRLSAVVSEFPGTWLECLPATGFIYGERQYELCTAMSLAGNRTVNWNLFTVDANRMPAVEAQLKVGPYAAERGARVYGLVPATPIKALVNFRTGVQLDMLPGWAEFLHLPKAEKLAAMKDAAVRQKLEEPVASSAQRIGLPADFGQFRIEHVGSHKNACWIGRLMADYAAEIGMSSFDAVFALVVEEDLDVALSSPPTGSDEASWALRSRVWQDEYAIIGASDAGAHLDAINTFAVTTQLLGEGVRERKILSLEDAVRRITSYPADIFGLKERGRLEVGAAADIVVFDPTTIDCGPISVRNDLPEGEGRLYAESVGIKQVIVNGILVAVGNEPTNLVGGKVLRSGTDTFTVPLPNHDS